MCRLTVKLVVGTGNLYEQRYQEKILNKHVLPHFDNRPFNKVNFYGCQRLWTSRTRIDFLHHEANTTLLEALI